MSGMQRRKGATGEREAAQRLNDLGLLCRRSAQYCGKSGQASDILCACLGVHLEVKRTEKFRLMDTVRQCDRDARGAHWAIMHRSNAAPWVIIQRVEHWVADSMAAQGAIADRQELIARLGREAFGDEPI